MEQDPLAVSGGLLPAVLVHRVHRAGPAAGADHAAAAHSDRQGDRGCGPLGGRGRHGVSWPTAHRAFVAHADEQLTEPQPTRVLGIDETRRGKPRWEYCDEEQRWVRIDPWDTGFVDLAGDQGLLGQREGRTGATVVEWLSERGTAFREAVEYVAIDPAAVYASAIRTADLVPNATIVVDHFHLVKLANDALTKVRRRVTWDLRDRRGRRIDPEWANRRRLLTARERLSPKSFAKMWNRIQAEDPSAQILTAWIAKEELRTLLSTVRRRRRPTPDPPPPAPVPGLVHRLADPRTTHPGRHHRHLVARDQRVRADRHHQRPHRGLQPAAQAGQTRRLRIPKPRQLGPPDTIPLHPQTAGRNPDFMLIARSKSKSPHTLTDTETLIGDLRALGFDTVVLGGLCAGAWVGLAVTRSGADVDGVIALNPQLYWAPGDPVEALMSTTRQRPLPPHRRTRGPQKANVAIQHWDQRLPRRRPRRRLLHPTPPRASEKRGINQLQAMGYQVTLTHAS